MYRDELNIKVNVVELLHWAWLVLFAWKTDLVQTKKNRHFWICKICLRQFLSTFDRYQLSSRNVVTHPPICLMCLPLLGDFHEHTSTPTKHVHQSKHNMERKSMKSCPWIIDFLCSREMSAFRSIKNGYAKCIMQCQWAAHSVKMLAQFFRILNTNSHTAIQLINVNILSRIGAVAGAQRGEVGT